MIKTISYALQVHPQNMHVHVLYVRYVVNLLMVLIVY